MIKLSHNFNNKYKNFQNFNKNLIIYYIDFKINNVTKINIKHLN